MKIFNTKRFLTRMAALLCFALTATMLALTIWSEMFLLPAFSAAVFLMLAISFSAADTKYEKGWS